MATRCMACHSRNAAPSAIRPLPQTTVLRRMSALPSASISGTTRPMKMHFLHVEQKSTQPPLVILHGLFGNSMNFRSFVNSNSQNNIAQNRTAFLLDLRNHGQTSHDADMSFPEMSADLLKFLDDHDIAKCDLFGFSMGGKVAAFSALQPEFADRIRSLVVGDIAPVRLDQSSWDIPQVLASLQNLDLSRVNKREDADALLHHNLPNPNVRLFLLTNLMSMPAGSPTRFGWRINLDFIEQNLQNLADFPAPTDGSRTYTCPTLFLRGSRSRMITDTTVPVIRRTFPLTELHTFEGAGHWIHNEQPKQFAETVRHFYSTHFGLPSISTTAASSQ